MIYMYNMHIYCTCIHIHVYMYYVIPLNGKITRAEVTATFYFVLQIMQLFSIQIQHVHVCIPNKANGI